MTLLRVLQLLRNLLGQSDLSVSNLTDSELLAVLREAAEELSLRKISGMDAFVIVTEAEIAGYGITPEPTTEQAHLMCTLAAVRILRDQFTGKLYRGELGINWKSGLEEESTISAAKEWKQVIKDLEFNLDVLITMNKSGSHATRPQ